jgi:ribosomal protein S12 methylthiotransferase accessory factor
MFKSVTPTRNLAARLIRAETALPPYAGLSCEDVRIDTLSSNPPYFLGRISSQHSSFPRRPNETIGMFAGAASGFDANEVRDRAFAELVEHVSAFVSGTKPGPRAFGTRRAVSEDARIAAVAPRTLTHFAHAEPPQGLDAVSENSVLTWVEGNRLDIDEKILVPALAAYLSWRTLGREPLFLRPGATGLAAHTRFDDAVCHGLLEVVERDACMLSWLIPGWPVRKLDSSIVDEELRRVTRHYVSRISIYAIGEPGMPAVVMALLHQADGSELTCGSASGRCYVPLVARATAEALMLQWTMRTAARRGQRVAPVDQPRSSLEHVARAFTRGADVLAWYESQAARAPREQVEHVCAASPTELARIVARTFGPPIISVDLRDAAARRAGWNVVRVLIPGAHPRESNARLAHDGGERLVNARARWSKKGDHVDYRPHPFG